LKVRGIPGVRAAAEKARLAANGSASKRKKNRPQPQSGPAGLRKPEI